MTSRSKTKILLTLSALFSFCLPLITTYCPAFAATPASAQQALPTILFKNVRVFDGKSDTLSAPSNVLVRGNKIDRISTADIPAEAGTTVIAGEKRTLIPGLIDAHWHAMFASIGLSTIMTADSGYINLVAGQEAGRTLMRGFTTVRDMGGPTFGLKRAIDDGTISGPRIYPSGAFISQTGGHGDFRMPYEVPREANGPLSHLEKLGATAIADGADQVLLRTREQLMQGASQIKLMAGGGITSNYDYLDVTQFSEAEIRAAVGAAEDWGTYVTVHVYNPRGIQRAIAAGVKCIEHGQLVDDATAKLMADKGIWWSLQPFVQDEDAYVFPDAARRAKSDQVNDGTRNAYKLASKYHIKTAWGTDILFDPKLADRQGKQLAKMTQWYTPAQVLKMATGDNAELLSLSGPRNPYPGKLGVVQEGALADLLLVDGDPLANINLISDPGKNFVVIVKDGNICKNALTK